MNSSSECESKPPLMDSGSDIDEFGDDDDAVCMFCTGRYSEDRHGEK